MESDALLYAKDKTKATTRFIKTKYREKAYFSAPKTNAVAATTQPNPTKTPGKILGDLTVGISIPAPILQELLLQNQKQI